MKTRIISALIFALVLLVILVINNPIVDTLFITILSLIGVYEYNKAFKDALYNPISWIGYIGCLSIFAIGDLIQDDLKISAIRIVLPIFLIAMFAYILFTNLKRSVIDIAISILSVLCIPFLFSYIKQILVMDNGRILIWFVILGAFASDTFAYFIGSKFGKKKLCPNISPKKTVEGAIGGIIGVLISYTLLMLIANTFFSMNFEILHIIISAIIASIAGQIGDLSFSAIKRFCKIKDFGTIIPGHGGILDRFDSILFVAPIIYVLLYFFI